MSSGAAAQQALLGGNGGGARGRPTGSFDATRGRGKQAASSEASGGRGKSKSKRDGGTSEERAHAAELQRVRAQLIALEGAQQLKQQLKAREPARARGRGDGAEDGAGSVKAGVKKKQREPSAEPAPRLPRERDVPGYGAFIRPATAAERKRVAAQGDQLDIVDLAPEANGEEKELERWPGKKVLGLVAKMCRGNEGSKPARVETIDHQTEGFAAVRTILARSGSRPSARCRGINEDDLYAIRDAVLARNEWIEGVTVESDVKWPHGENARSAGANCDATKFAKRLIWCEAALRLTLFVRGVENLTEWRRKMAFIVGMHGGSASESDGDGPTAATASAATTAETEEAASRLLGLGAATPPQNQEGLAEAPVSPGEYFASRTTADATKALAVADVYDAWRAAARDENDGEDAPEEGKARERMDALGDIDDFLVWEHADGFTEVNVPGMEWSPDTQPGVVYMGALHVTGDHIKRMARAVTAVLSNAGATEGLLQWARALIDELGIGTVHSDALEVMLISARPGITLAQRTADTQAYSSGEEYESLAVKMGWVSDLRLGGEVELAFKGRVARICHEAMHASAGRSGDARSPPKAKQRTASGGASAAAAMPNLHCDDADDEGDDEHGTEGSDSDEPMAGSDDDNESDAGAADDDGDANDAMSDVEENVANLAAKLGMMGKITAEQRKLLRTMVAADGGGKEAAPESGEDDDDGGGPSSAAEASGVASGSSADDSGDDEPAHERERARAAAAGGGRRGRGGGGTGCGDGADMQRRMVEALEGLAAAGVQHHGLTNSEHQALVRMDRLGDRERPAMEMTMAARNAIPGALTQLVGKDADMAPMGVPSGVCRVVERAAAVLAACKRHPPRGMLAMWLNGLTAKSSGFELAVFQSIDEDDDDIAVKVATAQRAKYEDARDGAGKATRTLVKWSPTFKPIDSLEMFDDVTEGLQEAYKHAAKEMTTGFRELVKYLKQFKKDCKGTLTWPQVTEELMKRVHKRAEELNNYQLGVSDSLPAWNDLHEDMVDDHDFKLRQERQYRRMLKQIDAERAAAGVVGTGGNTGGGPGGGGPKGGKGDGGGKGGGAGGDGGGAKLTDRQKKDREQAEERKKANGHVVGVCTQFRDTGKCAHGDKCRFKHEAVIGAVVKRETGNGAKGGGGGGKGNANAPPGPGGAARDWDAAWASREQQGSAKFKAEPDKRVKLGGRVEIKGDWILDFSRWSICEQTANTCWKRHVRAEKQCNCQICQRSKAWPAGVDEKLKPDGWSDQ